MLLLEMSLEWPWFNRPISRSSDFMLLVFSSTKPASRSVLTAIPIRGPGTIRMGARRLLLRPTVMSGPGGPRLMLVFFECGSIFETTNAEIGCSVGRQASQRPMCCSSCVQMELVSSTNILVRGQRCHLWESRNRRSTYELLEKSVPINTVNTYHSLAYAIIVIYIVAIHPSWSTPVVSTKRPAGYRISTQY